MQLHSTKESTKTTNFPQKITLDEEQKFFAQIDSGEIKVKSNQEVLDNLAKVLGLK